MRAMNQIQITTFNLQVTSRETESNQEKGGTDRRREQSPIIRHPDHPTVMEGFGSDTNPKETNTTINPQGVNADQSLEKESIP